MVESQPSKLLVAGSNPVSRSRDELSAISFGIGGTNRCGKRRQEEADG